MSISLLKTFIAIAEQGSFSAAAGRICVSHAAIGQQMRRLEADLQVTLFDRNGKVPKLNQLGRALVPKAREIIHSYETILDDLVGEAEFIGELKLGAVPSVIRGLVPRSIKKLIDTYPQLHVRVVPGLTPHLLGQVEQGSLDAAVISAPSNFSPNLNWQAFAEEELILLVSADEPLEDPVKLLKQKPYIRHTRHSTVGVMADEWLTKNNIGVRVSMEMESIDAIYSMVASNLGVSIVPNLCVPDTMFSDLKKLPLGKKTKPRVLGVLTHSDCSKINLVNRLLEEIKLTVSEGSED